MTFVDVDGMRIRYRAPRDPRELRGHPVLYIHGTGCDSRVWEDHLRAVAALHTPVAIDLPGHGESEGVGFRGVADYAHVAMAVARALGWQRWVVAGHSLGGGVALAAAAYHPTEVASLLLIDTGARLRVAPEVLDDARRATRGEPLLHADPRRGFAATTDVAVIEPISRIIDETDPHATLRDWIADDTCDFSARLGQFDVRALAVCGEEDDLTPVKYSAFFRDQLPQCELQIIPAAGHWSFIEQPAVFDRVVLDFLKRI